MEPSDATIAPWRKDMGATMVFCTVRKLALALGVFKPPPIVPIANLNILDPCAGGLGNW